MSTQQILDTAFDIELKPVNTENLEQYLSNTELSPIQIINNLLIDTYYRDEGTAE